MSATSKDVRIVHVASVYEKVPGKTEIEERHYYYALVGRVDPARTVRGA